MRFLLYALFLVPLMLACRLEAELTPITSAKQYIDYLATVEESPSYPPPETVVIVFSKTHLDRVLTQYNHTNSGFLSHLYSIDDGKVGLVGGFGIGAPALIHRMEELIAFGVKRFIIVGLAGSLSEELNPGDYLLCTRGLSEDGVGHLYMKPGQLFSSATPALSQAWLDFVQSHHPDHPPFHSGATWSFSVIFRESKEDVERVSALGCRTVELEAAACFAIAEEKGVEAMALFVISDSLAGGVWHPELKDNHIRDKLKALTHMAVEFAQATP